jgi:hypothetical protein
LLEVLKIPGGKLDKKLFRELLLQALNTRQWITKGIYESRAKDYENPFRKMVYDTEKEMEQVVGKLKDNSFINQQKEEGKRFTKQVQDIIQQFGL